jgi:O-antigen ligase
MSKAALYVMGFVSAFTIFKLYSKAGFVISAAWLLIWNGYRKNFLILGVVVVLLPILVLAIGPTSYLKSVEAVYSHETDVLLGRTSVEHSLSGRWAGWKEALQAWQKAPILLKVMGMGDKAVGEHNDFLRSLVSTGVIGLFLYLTLLASVGIRLFINCTRDPTPLNIVGVMIYVMWWVDSMGLVPGAYTSYQWFAWGFIGLALRGVAGLAVPGKATHVREEQPGKEFRAPNELVNRAKTVLRSRYAEQRE